MKKSLIVSLLLCLLMLSSGALTRAMTPTIKAADQQAKVNLETMVPTAFTDWQLDKTIVPLKVDPATQAKLDKIYNQTLSRTYVNQQGQRVMLSVAYGGDQSDSLSAHKPEVCYVAQGFEISKIFNAEMGTRFGNLPIKRLVAVHGNRNEPITYWITVGDKATRTSLEQKIQQMRYGLTGKVPDGMLVRVSTIDTDEAAAYQIQTAFIQDMLAAIDTQGRLRIAGAFNG